MGRSQEGANMQRPQFIWCAALGLLLGRSPLVVAEAEDFEVVSLYFAAHEDDWQLFMTPAAYHDVRDDKKIKVVFVHVTAGDNGLGTGTDGRKHPYYLARENGAKSAIRFMADVDRSPAEESAERIQLNGHSIYRVSYRNTVAYFLRLPDGHPSGSGFPATGNKSLERFAKATVKTMSAIDGSTTYESWNDLVGTLRAILKHEKGTASTMKLNMAELDTKLNPGDHSDHLTTAKAVLEAADEFPCARRIHYIDYATADLAENLSPEERDIENSVFTVTVAGILALDHSNHWDNLHRSWIGRSYSREIPNPDCGSDGKK
jgi:hypothetical protein